MLSQPMARGIAAGLLVAISAAVSQLAAQENITGTYCLSGVREVGSCFRFAPNQTFEYFLSYGAYDEQSEGRWRLDGNDVVLDSPPFDTAPRFVFKEGRDAPADRYSVLVVGPSGNGIAGIDVRVTCDGRTVEGYTQQDGYATPCASEPRDVALGLRMFGLAVQSVPATAPGKTLVFAFEPGDLGRKAFQGTRLQRQGDALAVTYRNPAMPDHDGRRMLYRRN